MYAYQTHVNKHKMIYIQNEKIVFREGGVTTLLKGKRRISNQPLKLAGGGGTGAQLATFLGGGAESPRLGKFFEKL